MSGVIHLENLRVIRGGRTVLHDLTLDIAAGTITGLLGPSGCGKTTLMRSIVGAQIIAGGSATVLGQPAGSPDLRRRIGYSTQAPAIYTDLTVQENLAYFGSILTVPRATIDRVIADLGLHEQRHQEVGSLSGGQRSRVSLAIALLGDPEILILDEPTVGLDPVLREDLWSLFHRLVSTRNVTMLVSSHVMDEAGRCQRLLLMRDGRILAHTTPAALLAETGADSLEQAFLRIVRNEHPAGIAS